MAGLFNRKNVSRMGAAAAVALILLLCAFYDVIHDGGFLLSAALGGLLLITFRQKKHLQAQTGKLQKEHEDLQRQTEAAQKRFQHIFDHAGDALFFIDPTDGSLLQVNPQGERMLGYSQEEIRRQSLSVLFPGRQMRRYLRLVRRVMRDGYGEEPALQLRRKDGEKLIGAVHARLGQLGEHQIVHGVIRDVTRFRQAENALRRRNRELVLLNEIARNIAGRSGLDELLQTILEDVIAVLEAHGGGIFLVRDEGTTLQLAVHRNISSDVLTDIRNVPPGLGLAGRVAASGHPQGSADVQTDLRLRSHAIRNAGWRGFQAIPLTAQEQTVGVLFLFNHDRRVLNHDERSLLMAIGHQVGTAIQGAELFEALKWQNRLTKASNRELQRSRRKLSDNLTRVQDHNRELKRLERMKSNFMALASHELRTPLTCVISGTQFLRDNLAGRLPPDEVQLFDAVLQGAQRLDTIVRDMLEAARLETNSLYLAREKVDLAVLLRNLGDEFSSVLSQRQLSFDLQPPPHPLELTGDAFHLKRTLSRLMENAVKYTPSGGEIAVHSRLRCFAEVQAERSALAPFSPNFFRDTIGGPLVQITVRDTGIGIQPGEHLRVFDKFYEIGEIDAHSTSRTRFGGKGVGLGLTLVKGMVEAHGGMVWLESCTGQQPGSAFHLLLPVSLDSVLGAAYG